MATYADLKAAILTDMNRDDLETDIPDALDRHVAMACEFYSDERFWFNTLRSTATTTGGVETVAYPAAMRIADRVATSTRELGALTLDTLPNDGRSGTPDYFVNYGDSLLLYPKPDGAYTLTLFGLKQVDAPSDDDDDNIWTNEARFLIAAHARATLCRDVFDDAEGTQRALGAVAEARDKLDRETAKRLAAPLRTELPLALSALTYSQFMQ